MFKSRCLRVGVLVCAFVCLSSPSWAAVTIDVGTWDIPAGNSSFEIPIAVSTDAGDTLTDMALLVQVADGGVAELGGSFAGPKITGLSLSGSIWEASPLGIDGFSSGLGIGDFDQLVQYDAGIAFSGGVPVPASGVLATLTVDATGFADGASFDLLLTGTAGGDSNFLGADTTVNNGTINIVPEPASMLLLAGLGGMSLLGRRRRE